MQSVLPLGHPLLASLPGGVYFLAISQYNNDPQNGSGLIFPSSPFISVFGPTGTGGALSVTDWSSNADGGGQYTIFLTGTGTGAPVPEPGTMLLVGSGIAALALRRRRRP